MAMIIGSPTRYIQGKGEMKNLCSYAKNFGKKTLRPDQRIRKRTGRAVHQGRPGRLQHYI